MLRVRRTRVRATLALARQAVRVGRPCIVAHHIFELSKLVTEFARVPEMVEESQHPEFQCELALGRRKQVLAVKVVQN